MVGAAPAEARVTGPFHPRSLALLQVALDWWQAQGFAYVDLPWLVPQAYSDATRPAVCRDIQTLHGSFVASGEQSFLALWDAGELPPGARGYIGWTPCLRDEHVLDDLHQHGFMKAEWFVPVDALSSLAQRQTLTELVLKQVELFKRLATDLPPNIPVAVVLTPTADDAVDLVLGGIEVGSYGVRQFKGRTYLYGTALAVPRFNVAQQAATA